MGRSVAVEKGRHFGANIGLKLGVPLWRLGEFVAVGRGCVSVFYKLLAILLRDLLISYSRRRPVSCNRRVNCILYRSRDYVSATIFFSRGSGGTIKIMFTRTARRRPTVTIVLGRTRKTFYSSLKLTGKADRSVRAFSNFAGAMTVFGDKIRGANGNSPVTLRVFGFRRRNRDSCVPDITRRELLVGDTPRVGSVVKGLKKRPVSLSLSA